MEKYYKNKKSELLSRAEKEAKDKEWYKRSADAYMSNATAVNYQNGPVSEEKRIQTNYDLFNGIVDIKELEYVCNPLGSNKVGELPAKMTNKDITSPKISALLGMEMKRPFSTTLIAVNPEATTRKEQEYFGRINQFVVDSIMEPIRQQIEIAHEEELANRELTDEERQAIMQKISQEIEKQTPPEVKKYMERKHQDPAEILYQQLLSYLTKKLNIEMAFNKVFKYGLLSGYELAYVGAFNGEPVVWALDPKYYRTHKSPDTDFLEDNEWATYDYYMSPNKAIKLFKNDLTKKQLNILARYRNNHNTENEPFYVEDGISEQFYSEDDLFSIAGQSEDFDRREYLKVTHVVWKALREFKFLTYMDENGETQEMLVDELYELNEDYGDIKIESEWLPEAYEAWVFDTDEKIYTRMQPLEGQNQDIDNLGDSKLPYYGARHSDMGGTVTSIMDRIKHFQYYYNMLWYKFELLAASDKGKKVMMNINNVPDSANFDLEKWQYYMEATPYMWYADDPTVGGYSDANTIAKVIDLSYAGQMNQYIEMMEYVRTQAGRTIGVTEAIEGQASANQSVRNNQQNLVQNQNILEPYFNLHDHVKKNILQALINVAKSAYSNYDKEYLSFVLDDMTVGMLKMDKELLSTSIIGLFIANSAKAQEAMQEIKGLAHAAMQNQKAELSDIAKLFRQDGILEAQEILEKAERERAELEERMATRKEEAQKELMQMESNENKEEHEREKEIIILKEEEKRKTEMVKGMLLGASFNPEVDNDSDGQNDYLQMLDKFQDNQFKFENLDLAKSKFEHQKDVDNKKVKQADKKLALDEKKIKASKGK